MNTWPNDQRQALDQSQHEAWNANHYPGTRQLCSECEDPTGRCEDDSLFRGDRGPLCVACSRRYDDDGNHIDNQPVLLLCEECDATLTGPDDGVNLCAECGDSMPFGKHE